MALKQGMPHDEFGVCRAVLPHTRPSGALIQPRTPRMPRTPRTELVRLGSPSARSRAQFALP